MKPRLLFATLLLSLCASPLIHAAGGDGTPLEEEMGAMNKAFRQLKKQAAESALGEASIPLVEQMQKATKASIELIPEKAAGVPEADRAAFIAAYKEKMQKMSEALAKLETALKAGDKTEAAKIVAELGAAQRSGHKEFRKPKE